MFRLVVGMCLCVGYGWCGVQEVIEEAQRDDQHLFLYFHRDQGGTEELQSLLVGLEARVCSVDVEALENRVIVKQFDAECVPLPFVVTLAPNGVVTGAFPFPVERERAVAAVMGRVGVRCVKELQEGKIVVLLIQNQSTEGNQEAVQVAEDFEAASCEAESCFSGQVTTLAVDPTDVKERPFLTQLGINWETQKVQTVLLAPPAVRVALYEGATSKETFVKDLCKASQGCCCPGGCCP